MTKIPKSMKGSKWAGTKYTKKRLLEILEGHVEIENLMEVQDTAIRLLEDREK